MTTEFDQLPSGPYAAGDSKSIFLGDDGHLNNEINALGPKKKMKSTALSGVSPGGAKYYEDFPKRPKGTTTLGFVYKEGVMIATDHFDASKDASEYFVENVIDLDSHVIVTVSGVGNTRSFLKNLRDQYLHEQESEKGRKPVLEVLEWVAEHLYSYCDKDSSAKMLIAVWDHETESPRLFSVDASDGPRTIAKKAVTGSGSRVVRSLLGIGLYNKGYAEALEHAKWAIDAAVCVLSFLKSGGDHDIEIGRYVSGYYVGADGWERVFYNELVTQKYFSEAVLCD